MLERFNGLCGLSTRQPIGPGFDSPADYHAESFLTIRECGSAETGVAAQAKWAWLGAGPCGPALSKGCCLRGTHTGGHPETAATTTTQSHHPPRRRRHPVARAPTNSARLAADVHWGRHFQREPTPAAAGATRADRPDSASRKHSQPLLLEGQCTSGQGGTPRGPSWVEIPETLTAVRTR